MWWASMWNAELSRDRAGRGRWVVDEWWSVRVVEGGEGVWWRNSSPGSKGECQKMRSIAEQPKSSRTAERMPRRAQGNCLAQAWKMRWVRREAFSERCRRPTIPLLYGWYEEVLCSFILRAAVRWSQRADVNWAPWSIIRLRGMPKHEEKGIHTGFSSGLVHRNCFQPLGGLVNYSE